MIYSCKIRLNYLVIIAFGIDKPAFHNVAFALKSALYFYFSFLKPLKKQKTATVFSAKKWQSLQLFYKQFIY